MNQYKLCASWSDGGRFETAWTTRESIEEQTASMIRNIEKGTALNITILTLDSVTEENVKGVSHHTTNYFKKEMK